MRVHDNIPRAQAIRSGWQLITTRLIDINKDGDDNPQYRCMLIGNEFTKEQIDCLFAGNSPTEAFRCLIHEAAIVRVVEPTACNVLMVNDVSQA